MRSRDHLQSNGWTPERNWLRKLKQKTNDQTQSIWFMLPLEIREMIYHDVLGGNRVAVDAKTVKGLTGVGEWHNSRFTPSRSKWMTLRDNWGVPPMTGNDWNKVEGLLNLVMSCRRIYSESINILYSANVFRKSFLPLNWNRMMLPQRMNAIRTLVVDFDIGQALVLLSCLRGEKFDGQFKGSPKNWRSAWKKIMSMESLRSLHLRIRVRPGIDKHTSHPSQEEEVALLQPFLDARHFDFYEVLFWYPDGHITLGNLNGNNGPYQLIRVKEVISTTEQVDCEDLEKRDEGGE